MFRAISMQHLATGAPGYDRKGILVALTGVVGVSQYIGFSRINPTTTITVIPGEE
jgi:hypothetical protein